MRPLPRKVETKTMPDKGRTEKDDLFQEPRAKELAQIRMRSRKKRRLIYDCMNAVVQGDGVTCREGHEFKGYSRDKGIPLLTVLRGTASSTCQECGDYDGEEHE